MAVQLPTSEEIRNARKNAAKAAAGRAEVARTPLLAVLGAGDAAVTAVAKAVAEVRTRVASDSGNEELRKLVSDLRTQAGKAYTGFAEHGEQTWGKIRTQPQVKEAFERIGSYTEKLDARVDSLVDDARDAAEKALSVVSSQTRAGGEKVAKVTERFSTKTADAVEETVATEPATPAETVTEIKPKTASKAAPKTTAAKPAASKPATRRTATNGKAGE